MRKRSTKAFAPVPLRAVADARMTTTHFRAICAIAYRDRLGGGCFASSDELAELAGVNAKNLITAISELVAWGYVSRTPSPKDKRQRVHRVIYDEIGCPQATESGGDRLPKQGDRLPKSKNRLPKKAPKPLRKKETADPHSHRIQPLEDSHIRRGTAGRQAGPARPAAQKRGARSRSRGEASPEPRADGGLADGSPPPAADGDPMAAAEVECGPVLWRELTEFYSRDHLRRLVRYGQRAKHGLVIYLSRTLEQDKALTQVKARQIAEREDWHTREAAERERKAAEEQAAEQSAREFLAQLRCDPTMGPDAAELIDYVLGKVSAPFLAESLRIAEDPPSRLRSIAQHHRAVEAIQANGAG